MRWSCWIVLVCVATAHGGVSLPKVFTDHMVVQRDMPVAVWGRADPGEKIAVSLAGLRAEAQADSKGHWRVDLPALRADGAAHVLTVRGTSETRTFKDVLIGEVWLCGGQSNMGRPVGGEAAKRADHPRIRLFNSSGETPRRHDLDRAGGWWVCTPESIRAAGDYNPHRRQRRGFTEVGYHFGRRLHLELKVPIGLIQVNCGGSTAQDWTPAPGVEAQIPYDEPVEKITHRPGYLYHTRLRPMVPFRVRGAIWYQGEDDGRNRQYAQDFRNLIESWRGLRGRPDMPFYFVQIAQTTYASGMLGVWEAQSWVMNHVPHTGMAVSNDIYEGTANGGFKLRADPKSGRPIAGGGNPHPTGKPLVAERLAQIALVKTYGAPQRVVFGPMYDSHEIAGSKIRVRFKHVGGGLATADGRAPNWFELSDGAKEGRGLKFTVAEARIVGKDVVEVSAPAVAEPRFVRFGWHPLVRHNLINREGLPAVVFRTDPEPR